MPHGGRTSQELFAAGITDPTMLQHALFDESQVAPTGDLDGLIECINAGNSVDECLGQAGDEGEGEEGPGDTTRVGTVREDIRVQEQLTGVEKITSEELTTQLSREYFEVQTAEKFLDDFFNAFAGFAQSASAAGLSGGDIETMLNPASGFMQSMLTEYIGQQAQRAAAGEDIYEVVGVDGQEEFIGTRTGDVTRTEVRRMTRTEAEETLRRQGETVTTESIQQTIDADMQSQQSAITTITDQEVTTQRDTTREQIGVSEFREEVEIFARPRLDQVFKFSPSDFLQQRFGAEELDESAIGRIATEIRASAPRVQPRGGITTSVGARRA